MKKFAFLVVLASLLVAPLALAVDRLPANVSPAGVTVAVPNIAVTNAPPLEVITIVHYKKDFAKPAQTGKPTKATACYGFISGKAKLLSPADVLVNPTNSGMIDSDVLNTLNTSINTWDSQTSAAVFGSLTPNYTANFDSTADGKDEISFGPYSQPGVIAVTRIWGYFSGSPASRYISEFDLLFNTAYTWGNADLTSTVMDLQNIAIHELGHALGLNDIYTSSCSAVTMYGYSDYGETSKRTLEAPDITGLRTLYGI